MDGRGNGHVGMEGVQRATSQTHVLPPCLAIPTHDVSDEPRLYQ